MIIGLGSDLCNIERIQNSIDRFGTRFENRVFTEVERAKAQRRPFTEAGTYAKRFAAKEAFSKAVGTGFRRGVFMKDIGVVNAPSGAPTLALSGGGIRAMVFHLGTLQYLANRSLLERVTHISSVSGGSLIVGLIIAENNMRWPTSREYLDAVLPALRDKLCHRSLQWGALLC